MVSGARSLPVRERGSKPELHYHFDIAQSRSPCGSVDRNELLPPLKRTNRRRSPCGSVDRNFSIVVLFAVHAVAPRAGAWIETPISPRSSRCRSSLPVRERGSKRQRPELVDLDHASLPVRERGSKLAHVAEAARRQLSLPVRERGSKHLAGFILIANLLSLPVRERGSKLGFLVALGGPIGVAPRAGAWIETPDFKALAPGTREFAPRAGAWIETPSACS